MGPAYSLASTMGLIVVTAGFAAPFALLGSLFGGGPDLQFIDFEPGAADLDSGAVAKAQTIVKALNERPQLKIEVPIGVVEAHPDRQLATELYDEAFALLGQARKQRTRGRSRERFRQPVGQRFDHDRIVIVVVGAEQVA